MPSGIFVDFVPGMETVGDNLVVDYTAPGDTKIRRYVVPWSIALPAIRRAQELAEHRAANPCQIIEMPSAPH